MSVWRVVAVAVFCSACGRPAAVDSTATPATGLTGAADARPAVAAPAAAPERLREVTIPAGTTLRLTLRSAIASETSHVEDAVRAELRQPLSVDGRTVLPAGTEVAGVVTDVARSGRVKGRARIAYRFTSLRADGERYALSTAALSHQAPASKGDDAKKIAIGAGAGAALGAILGGGDGAAKGAAIGGAGGTGAVLATRGKEVSVGPGAAVTARLTKPLTVRVRG